MAVLQEPEAVSLLKKNQAASNGMLIFGNDEAGIAALARKLMSSFASDEDHLRLEASSLRDDPALLLDAFRARSLLGDRRLILVEGCEENHLRYLESVIVDEGEGNFVVLKAGNLAKASKLRDAATAAKRFHVIAVYEDSPQSLLERVHRLAREQKVAFAEGAAEKFLQLAGSSRGQVEGELEKLLLYCSPSPEISLADVEASCGDQASFDVDVLSAAMLDGDIETADRVFQAIRADGDWRQVLIVLQMQFARLEGVKADMAGGGDMDKAFRSAKPPVFFGQQKAMARHLRVYSLEDISQFGMALQAAVLASRQHGDLAEAVASRAILSLARRAKQLRQQR